MPRARSSSATFAGKATYIDMGVTARRIYKETYK
ncbi:hypothetical protein ACVI1N_000611 [Sinorhizobium medicae]